MRSVPRVALLQPPVDDRFRSLDMTFARLAPSTGLAILACETERRLQGMADVQTHTLSERDAGDAQSWVDSDVLGISTWFSNYENAIALAKKAKHRDPSTLTIVGGVNAGNLGPRVLHNRREVDLVVSGDGEDVLWRILAGHDYASIPNLWYRDDAGAVRWTFSQCVDLGEIGLWDFRHAVDAQLADYDSRQPAYQIRSDLPPIGLSMTRGCRKAVGPSGRCDYCSIRQEGLRATEATNVWRQVQHLQEMHGIESFFETGDDFTHLGYIKTLVTARPERVRFRLRGYASPWTLTDRCVESLAELGVYEVFLGLETADESIACRVGHRSSRKDVLAALDRLAQAGITVCLPFLLGLPGETKESAQETASLARDLVERYTNVRMVLLSLAIPLVGSRWFERLSQYADIRTAYGRTRGDLANDDVIDYFRLLELGLERESSVSIGFLLELLASLRDQLQDRVLVGSFGAIETLHRARTHGTVTVTADR